MAVFTKVSGATLRQWLSENYGLGLAGEPMAITEGIENTNYSFTDTNGDKFIFTVIEVWDWDVAQFCIGLAHHLSEKGMPVPRTLANVPGNKLATGFAGKPACVVEFVDGTADMQPQAAHCSIIGGHTARLHHAVADFKPAMPNQRGAKWRREAVDRVRPSLGEAERALLDSALAVDDGAQGLDLPLGACHCDIFRNNVLWRDDRVAGIIDFYFAGVDTFVFDLCVLAADWAMDCDGNLDDEKLAALLQGYGAQRALTEEESKALPAGMVCAALRFWLTRLDDHLHPRQAHELIEHEPEVFRRRLETAMARREDIAGMASLALGN